MPQIPSDDAFDNSLALFKDGYKFIQKRCGAHETDIFQTRLMLQKTICMKGEEAARLFYDQERFKRNGAAPLFLKATLFGFGGVQGLDAADHWNRKQMFMSLMTGSDISTLFTSMKEKWHTYARRWEKQEQVVLFDEVQKMLCEVICEWTGVPLKPDEISTRASHLGNLSEAPGAIGIRFWRGRKSRRQAEKWIGSLIKQVREKRLLPPQEKALSVVARHETRDEEQLDTHTAAVELLNILRPTVAVGRYIVFAALALYHHPESVQKIREDEEGNYLSWFIQEVRRFYPFFPMVAARVKKDFEWKGYSFPRNTRVVLDLYGTNHDERLWAEPGKFRPERFRDREVGQFDFIPQGGGDHHKNHRCPGEFTTIDLMKTVIPLLTTSISYNVPPQDLSIDLTQIPAIPKSRFIIDNVRLHS